MSWVLLVVAGLLEVGWASALPATAGLTRPAPTAAFVSLLAGSMFLLARAAHEIPLSQAYAVWVGIGTIGTVVVGVAVRHEALTPASVGFLALLVVAIVGLKVTGGH